MAYLWWHCISEGQPSCPNLKRKCPHLKFVRCFLSALLGRKLHKYGCILPRGIVHSRPRVCLWWHSFLEQAKAFLYCIAAIAPPACVSSLWGDTEDIFLLGCWPLIKVFIWLYHPSVTLALISSHGDVAKWFPIFYTPPHLPVLWEELSFFCPLFILSLPL